MSNRGAAKQSAARALRGRKVVDFDDFDNLWDSIMFVGLNSLLDFSEKNPPKVCAVIVNIIGERSLFQDPYLVYQIAISQQAATHYLSQNR